MEDKRNVISKIKVKQRALKIDEVEDKVRFAVDAYKRAFEKYQRGADSTSDWTMVIRALSLEYQEIREYIAVAHHNIGVIYAKKGDFALAMESFRTALTFNPEYAVAHNNLSIVYRKTGDMENYQKHQDEARRLGFKANKK